MKQSFDSLVQQCSTIEDETMTCSCTDGTIWDGTRCLECQKDEILYRNSCIRVFNTNLEWHDANEFCSNSGLNASMMVFSGDPNDSEQVTDFINILRSIDSTEFSLNSLVYFIGYKMIFEHKDSCLKKRKSFASLSLNNFDCVKDNAVSFEAKCGNVKNYMKRHSWCMVNESGYEWDYCAVSACESLSFQKNTSDFKRKDEVATIFRSSSRSPDPEIISVERFEGELHGIDIPFEITAPPTREQWKLATKSNENTSSKIERNVPYCLTLSFWRLTGKIKATDVKFNSTFIRGLIENRRILDLQPCNMTLSFICRRGIWNAASIRHRDGLATNLPEYTAVVAGQKRRR
ncbi:hypothetical protein ACOME3_007935 [Neoechinorhynchus agilis]